MVPSESLLLAFLIKFALYPTAGRTKRERGMVCNPHKRHKERSECMVPSESLFLVFSDKFASYRAAGANAGNEPERKGAAELPEIRKVNGTQ